MPDAGSDKSLVVGYGSAGMRHARVLQALGREVAVVSRRPLELEPTYQDLAAALSAEQPENVVIANETVQHLGTLADLAGHGYRGSVLVEKPLASGYGPLPDHGFERLAVGYQLRFHPVVRRLRELLAETRPIAVQAYVGQHLATWRPDRPYAESYSSRAEAGGGALRDLSHEIDLLLWLFGGWKRIAALGGNHGALDIDSDDAFAILLETEACPIVSLQLNYLDHPGRREILVNGAERTIHADLLNACIAVDGAKENFETSTDQLCRAMHEAFLGQGAAELCSPGEAQDVMRAIEATEVAALNGRWIAK